MMTRKFVKMAASVGLRFGPVRKGVTPKRILDFIVQDMVRIRDDYVLTDNPVTTATYQGMFDAYRNVAHYIAPLTNIEIDVD